MIRRVREHNHLNGIVFVIVEFIIVAAAALFIAVGFASHANLLGSVLAVGIAVNCIVVIGFAMAAYGRGERGASLRDLFAADYRAQVSRDHPRLMTDTLVLTLAVLVPYGLTVLVGYEAATLRGRP